MARSENASNHKLKYIKEIFHRFHEINPPFARSFVLTPKELADKKAIINPKNEADKRPLYATGISVFSDDFGNKNLERISKKLLKCCERLNNNYINFAPSIKDIEQFKKW